MGGSSCRPVADGRWSSRSDIRFPSLYRDGVYLLPHTVATGVRGTVQSSGLHALARFAPPPDRMNQQNRMIKTLACLAVAMTATSALLSWIDPSPPLPRVALSTEELAGLGQSLVTDGVTVREGRWARIEISAGDAGELAGSYLAATSHSTTHFLVDLDGRPTRTTRWVRQEDTAQDGHSIRIEVARHGSVDRMSRVQWLAVRGLVAAIHARIADGPSRLPVLLQGGWAAAYGLEPGTRLDLAPLNTASY